MLQLGSLWNIVLEQCSQGLSCTYQLFQKKLILILTGPSPIIVPQRLERVHIGVNITRKSIYFGEQRVSYDVMRIGKF